MDGWVVGTGQEQPGERAGSQAGKRSAEGAPGMLELTVIPHNEIHHFLKVCQLGLLVRWRCM